MCSTRRTALVYRLPRRAIKVRDSFAVWMYHGMWQVVGVDRDGVYADCMNVANGEMGYIAIRDLPAGEALRLARALASDPKGAVIP